MTYCKRPMKQPVLFMLVRIVEITKWLSSFLTRSTKLFSFHFFRGKNFEKGSEYANTWNKDDDGKVNTDGPRVVVGDQGGFQGQMITRYELRIFTQRVYIVETKPFACPI